VECYLEPNKPFNLLLTKSAAYFDPFPQEEFDFIESILADSAEVTIEHNGQIYVLEN
jgi:hemin uptake protein HemP